jgi:uncharacterized protein
MLANGIRVTADPVRAVAMFERGCASDHADSCNAVAQHLSMPGTTHDEDDLVRKMIPIYEKGCALGSAKACNNLGSYLRRPSLGRRSESTGFFERSCMLEAASNSTGCFEAAETYRNGAWGVAKDTNKAAELFARACKLGNYGACATATSLGKPTTLSPTEGAAATQRSCFKDGSLRSCLRHGTDLKEGRGIGRDPKAAESAFDLVCAGDQDTEYGCMQLARMRLDGDLGKIDIVGAIAPLRKACEGEDGRARSCRTLADLTVMGTGVAQDTPKAIALYQRACSLDPPTGCQQAGALAKLQGNDVAAIAEGLFAQGCRAGDVESCRALERAGLSAQLLRAARADEQLSEDKRCEDGDARVCLRLGERARKGKDHAAARRYFELSCTAGEPEGCNYLAICAGMGQGGPKEPDLELASLTRACVLGKENACAPARGSLARGAP